MPEGRRDAAPELEMDDIDMDRLERELEGDGTESDSSLDLHTPFAYVVSFFPPVVIRFSMPSSLAGMSC